MTPDEELEHRIETARVAMTQALAPETQRYWCDKMTQLIGQRSPEQVHRMELAKGLSR